MDPAMGLIGAVLVARWSLGLLRTTSGVLLDRQGPLSIRRAITESIEADRDSRVADLHVWSIGPSGYAAIIAIAAHAPSAPEDYSARIPTSLGLAHVSIQVHKRTACLSGQGHDWRVAST
jgi:Co/Zn/Cd efflux system component